MLFGTGARVACEDVAGSLKLPRKFHLALDRTTPYKAWFGDGKSQGCALSYRIAGRVWRGARLIQCKLIYSIYIYIDKPQTTEQPILMYSVLSWRCIMSSSVREAQEACTSFGHMSFFHFDLQQCSNSHFPLFQAPAKERTQLTPLLLAKVWISIHSILLRWGV